jgi:hypothetical protein
VPGPGSYNGENDSIKQKNLEKMSFGPSQSSMFHSSSVDRFGEKPVEINEKLGKKLIPGPGAYYDPTKVSVEKQPVTGH